MYIVVGIHGDNQVFNNNDIKLPPLRDTDSPSPSLKTLYPKQHYDHHRYHEDSTTAATFSSSTLTGAADASPISSSSSSSSSPSYTNEVIADDSIQHQQSFSISKCKHFHGRSLSADDANSIPFSTKPPWISKPLRIITATTDPTTLSTTTTSNSRRKHRSTSSMTMSLPSRPLSMTSSPSTFYHHETINNKSMHQQKPTPKYACTYCRKAFTRPSSLRTHVYSHTGQKPFACTFRDCDKRFSVLSNMRRHMRRHSVPTAFASPSTTISSSSTD